MSASGSKELTTLFAASRRLSEGGARNVLAAVLLVPALVKTLFLGDEP